MTDMKKALICTALIFIAVCVYSGLSAGLLSLFMWLLGATTFGLFLQSKTPAEVTFLLSKDKE